MRPFYKIGLLLGFISFVSFQNQLAWGGDDDKQISSLSQNPFSGWHLKAPKPIQTLRAVIGCYFTHDSLESPFEGEPDARTQLADEVAGYMRKADKQRLISLFYDPKFDEWKEVYGKVAPDEPFSTIDLIILLDETKTKIFSTYKVQRGVYFHIPTLIDNALQKIFTGCWGISNSPQKPYVIDNLKQIYGRVVFGVFSTSEDTKQSFDALLASLEKDKEGSLSRNKHHVIALQECAAAVFYKSMSLQQIESFLAEVNQRNKVSLNASSFEQTLKKIETQPKYFSLEQRLIEWDPLQSVPGRRDVYALGNLSLEQVALLVETENQEPESPQESENEEKVRT